ncbi:MAG: adenylate/guanylate cyclase domain-containing protein [Solirubrobacterales bacterium]
MAPLVERLASLGAVEGDTENERIRKGALTISTVLVGVLTPIWIVTYAVLGLALPASIPAAYLAVSAASLAVFAKTKRYRVFRAAQLILMLALPFALQWSLGGFVASSGVCLWALTSPMGALVFAGTREAVPWFGAYLGLIAISTALEPFLDPATMPAGVQIAFFAGNVAGVSLTAYLLLQYFVREREREHERSERLLLNVLPAPVARRLKQREQVIADRFEEATVLFADLVGFTPLATDLSPERLVEVLDEVFSSFDALAQERGLEKIKTIGDAYMVAGGVPTARADHREAVLDMAFEMLEVVRDRNGLELRIGVDSGPVVAGVIGRRKFIYDLWGDTVNTASRMESQGVPGRIQVTERLARDLDARFRAEPRGDIDVKGKGSMPVFLLSRSGA